MNAKIKKYLILPIISIIILGSVFVLGVYLGYSKRPEVEKVLTLTNKEIQVETTTDFDPFWKAWNILNEKSIYTKETSDQEKVWGAISGLASSFNDPYTVFFPPKENELFNNTIKGSFEGIGAEVAIRNKTLTIVAPLKGTPAWNSGLKAGDQILKIDGKETTDMTIDKAISLIQGKKGTPVVLTIFRSGETKNREIEIIRGIIDIPTIETEFNNEKNIFIIKFYSFSENSTKLFKKALIEFLNSKSNKLIIDLRGNPGGYLNSAINITSWFVEEGKPIVREDFGDKEKENVFRSYGPKVIDEKYKIVILIDKGSASASEIFAGALREYNMAQLVGEKTFGKGSVQELIKITNDTSLKVTVAKWLTPKGVSISDEGLKPDVEVLMTQKDYNEGRDLQMEKAIEILSQ